MLLCIIAQAATMKYNSIVQTFRDTTDMLYYDNIIVTEINNQ